MMLFFKKKEPEKAPPLGKGFIPIEKIRDLSSKGFSEPEIIDVLRKEGFSPDEIDKGLTQSLKGNITAPPQPSSPPTLPSPSPKAPEQRLPTLPTLEQIQPRNMPEIPETSLPQDYYYPEGYSAEEYVDYVVRERTEEMERKMAEFLARYDELEKRMDEVHERLNELGKMRRSEQQQILNRIDSFKEVVNDVDTRLSSVEKAFKETLPALIESVRALSDLVGRIKRED